MTVQSYSLVRQVLLVPPSVGNNTADSERLVQQLKKELDTDHIYLDLGLIREIPRVIRECDFSVKCVLTRDKNGYRVCGISGSEESDTFYGAAVDLGTTRIAFKLMNLETGEEYPEVSFDNPQIRIGPDVLARIHYADTEDKISELQRLVSTKINDEISRQCRSLSISMESICLVSLAGNTIMTHLFLEINPHHIIREPYIPAVNVPGLIKASDAGLFFNKHCRVYVFPNIGSYFGGDLIAGILYSGMNRKDDISILVDVGTNAEVVLGNRDWLIGCAGAAGPALEGGVTKMGMNAGPGVIDRIVIDPDTRVLDIHTIDNRTPIGICGSGLIDLAAQLFLSGMIDIRGKFMPEICGDRLYEQDEIFHFIVVAGSESASGSDLTLSQVDLDSLIRSKAAMYTILNTIAESAGITPGDFSKF